MKAIVMLGGFLVFALCGYCAISRLDEFLDTIWAGTVFARRRQTRRRSAGASSLWPVLRRKGWNHRAP